MFSTFYGTYFPFQMHFKMSSAICLNLDQSKILSSGNGLRIASVLWQDTLENLDGLPSTSLTWVKSLYFAISL